MGHRTVKVTSDQFSEYLSQGLLLLSPTSSLTLNKSLSLCYGLNIYISSKFLCLLQGSELSFSVPFFLSLSSFLLLFPHFSFLLSLLKLFSLFLILSLSIFLPNQPERLFPSHCCYSSIIHYLIGIHYLIQVQIT